MKYSVRLRKKKQDLDWIAQMYVFVPLLSELNTYVILKVMIVKKENKQTSKQTKHNKKP